MLKLGDSQSNKLSQQAERQFKSCVNGDMSFLLESLFEFMFDFWLFRNTPGGQIWLPSFFAQNGLNDVGSRKDVSFGV